MSEWSDSAAEAMGFDCEPGVGLTVADDAQHVHSGSRWFSWDETLALHAWLTHKIAEANT